MVCLSLHALNSVEKLLDLLQRRGVRVVLDASPHKMAVSKSSQLQHADPCQRFPVVLFFGVANIYEHCANDSPMHEEKVVDGSAFRGSFHRRPLVGVSRPRSWSRLLVLGAILREIVFKT